MEIARVKLQLPHYKYIMLVIDDDSDPVYSKFREVWRKYGTTEHRILTLFVRIDDTIPENSFQVMYLQQQLADTLKFGGEDTYVPGIFNKTINALRYCLNNYSFDYIIRTHLSSFWNYPALMRTKLPLSRIGVYGGVVETKPYSRDPFVSGKGLFMSKDVVEILVSSGTPGGIAANKFCRIYDDVAITKILALNNIRPTEQLPFFDRYDITDICNDTMNEQCKKHIQKIKERGIFHIHVKNNCTKRSIIDAFCMDQLYDAFYTTYTVTPVFSKL